METNSVDTNAEPRASSLGDINKLFHQLYAEKTNAVRKQVDEGDILLLCRMDNRLILKAGSDVKEFTINGDYYHSLKALAHSTLAVFYMIMNSTSDTTLNEVSLWVNQIEQDDTSQIASRIVSITRKLVTSIKGHQNNSHSAITDYQRELEPVYAELLMLSAKDELTILVDTLNHIKRDYDYASSNTFLVTLGGHQPRYKELSTLIFTRWFREQFSHVVDTNHYVRYCEGGSSLDDAVNLVVTAITDRQLGNSMVGSAVSLNQDVLGIVANKAIDLFWPDEE
ncbi:hypothetical protein [Alteromonas antoniana]|uniref:hypothetical protein n=1 Tax=Alteromonas antoniana TaxID=2803813 RepID=UPI001C464D46|nr:hypothetical protein [Alteromonas antoniana]